MNGSFMEDITQAIINGTFKVNIDDFSPVHYGPTEREIKELEEKEERLLDKAETLAKIKPVEEMALYQQDDQFFDVSIHDFVTKDSLYRFLVEKGYISFYYNEAPEYLQKFLDGIKLKYRRCLDDTIQCYGFSTLIDVKVCITFHVWNESDNTRIRDQEDPMTLSLA